MARIAVVRQFYVPSDPRVRREINALLDAGHTVDVICMRRPGQPRIERHDRLTIRRLPMSHRRGGAARYVFEYLSFPLLAAIRLAVLDRRVKFDLVQVNTLPDWLVFAAIGPRLRGVPVLLDLHECTPEFFVSKFQTSMRHPVVRLVALLERASIGFATESVTCTTEMRRAFAARGSDPSRIGIVMNAAEESLFDAERYPPRPREAGRFNLVCHGSMEDRYGLDTTILAVERLRDEIPELTLELYGEGSDEERLRALAHELDLDDRVSFHGYVPFDDLVAAVADADAGVVAMKPDIFRNLTHCHKMFDLITMQRPVICSRTDAVLASFPHGLVYFDGGDDADLARAITDVYRNPEWAAQLVADTTAANEPYRWPRQAERYLAVVDRLLGRATSPVPLDAQMSAPNVTRPFANTGAAAQ